MAEDWSPVEVEATVADYLAMLASGIRGEPVNKAEHNRNLRKGLNKRSKSAVEFKHQNISAIMIELGLPPLPGYQPMKNYQRLLYDVVVEQIENTPSLIQLVAADVVKPAAMPPVDDILDALVDPPEPRDEKYPKETREGTRRRIGIDYLAREAANRSLGAAGELFVLTFERERLVRAGKDGLADRIEHISINQGDGAGFDIRSFETSGADRLVEVKTTRYPKETPFYITQNELAVSWAFDRAYHLYRVFEFRSKPQLYLKKGQLDRAFRLSPATYQASVA